MNDVVAAFLNFLFVEILDHSHLLLNPPRTVGAVTRKQCCGSGSGIRCLFDPWIRGWVKKSGSESGSRIRDEQPRIMDHVSENLETIVWVKILKFFDADPGSGNRCGKNSDPGWKKF
jgi:hypothetical protein